MASRLISALFKPENWTPTQKCKTQINQLMIINIGEYVHIIHRQFFQSDAQRHFVGTVEAYEGELVRVKGYLFAMDSTQSQFVRREELRTRIISLNESVIVNILPSHVKIDEITYTHRPNGDIFVTDGTEWHLNITHL